MKIYINEFQMTQLQLIDISGSFPEILFLKLSIILKICSILLIYDLFGSLDLLCLFC